MLKLNSLNDTIAAISTPIGQAGIGIVRINGKDALNIADKIFLPAYSKGKSKEGEKSSRFKTYTVHYGWIVNGHKPQALSIKRKVKSLQPACPGSKTDEQAREACNLKPEIIDEVILSVMRAPKSYTKEDIVEINCHSGIVNLRRILDLVLKSGARLADPGEFTKRAFLNGRIDLAQAEAVLDIIQAKTEASLKLGIEQLKGELSSKINNIREKLLDVFANLEASIDFPEEDINTHSLKYISKQISNVQKELRNLLETSSKGKILKEGIKVVIAGRPNVGKSSLLNALLEEERSIVTPIPGTTRDTIEELINLGGIPVRLFDTAGIIEPKDLIEKEALKRAKEKIQSAELVLLVLDAHEGITKEDKIFIEELKGKPKIIIINKIDLPQKINKTRLNALKLKDEIIKISALKIMGLKELEALIAKKISPDKLTGDDEIIVSNIRHIDSLRKSLTSLERARQTINNKFSIELISFEIKEAIENLDAIIGKSTDEDLLDKIFSGFCIGK